MGFYPSYRLALEGGSIFGNHKPLKGVHFTLSFTIREGISAETNAIAFEQSSVYSIVKVTIHDFPLPNQANKEIVKYPLPSWEGIKGRGEPSDVTAGNARDR